MTPNEELIAYIKTLTEEQAAKVLEKLNVVKHLIRMTPNERIFTEEFLNRLFGEVG